MATKSAKRIPPSSLVEEMHGGDLGDRRLNARRDRVVAVLEEHPAVGFPAACADEAEVEALYRFLRNRRVSLEGVLAPHRAATQRRCTARGHCLVLHDTTDMVFAGEAARPGLARLGPARQGFWVHAALAVSADAHRTPLGVLSLLPFIRKTQPPGMRKREVARFVDPGKESRYWIAGVAAVHAGLPPTTTAIHIMDRGADSYELFAHLLAHGERFVIRLHHDRPVLSATGTSRLSARIGALRPQCTREVPLSTRKRGKKPLSYRRHPPRLGRLATLQFAAEAVRIQRPPGRHYAHLPPTLAVHVVAVTEVNPPADDKPVEWSLMTTEPIATEADLLRVVDWYRARWSIEEFFKALKTGCAYETRQLESWHTLLVALGLLAPVAWQLLLLRQQARTAPDAPASTVCSHRQVQLLRAVPAGARLSAAPTTFDILGAVARLGGHLAHNGPPGWQILSRGLCKLLAMEQGWIAATLARSDQS